jgi:hypothetical protein
MRQLRNSSGRSQHRRRPAFLLALVALATVSGFALAVSASSGDETSDNLSLTVTSSTTPEEQPGEPQGETSPADATPAPDQPSGPPPNLELPSDQRWLTAAEVRSYVPPGEEHIITRGVAVQEDPSKIERGVDCPLGTDVCPDAPNARP